MVGINPVRKGKEEGGRERRRKDARRGRRGGGALGVAGVGTWNVRRLSVRKVKQEAVKVIVPLVFCHSLQFLFYLNNIVQHFILLLVKNFPFYLEN